VKSAAKRAVLYGVLAFSAAVAWYANTHNAQSEVVAVSERPTARSVAKDINADVGHGAVISGTESLRMADMDRHPSELSDVDPFAVKSWAVAASAAPVAPPPQPKPIAPPLPYSYAGKIQEDDGRWMVYLVKGETSYEVHQGETFDSVYRLNTVGTAQLEIEYLPLSTKQALLITQDPQ